MNNAPQFQHRQQIPLLSPPGLPPSASLPESWNRPQNLPATSQASHVSTTPTNDYEHPSSSQLSAVDSAAPQITEFDQNGRPKLILGKELPDNDSGTALVTRFVENTCEKIPTSYREALASPERDQWIKAMDTEYQSQLSNNTWQLRAQSTVPISKGVIGCRWVITTKLNANGTVRYKARPVIKGFQQRSGVDFEKSYASVARPETFRMLVALAAVMDWEIEQLDVVTALLNGELDEPLVFMEQPAGYETVDAPGRSPLVCKLQKALYGLKQAPRIWHGNINNYLIIIGFARSQYDGNLYSRHDGGDITYLPLWVNDMLIFASSTGASD